MSAPPVSPGGELTLQRPKTIVSFCDPESIVTFLIGPIDKPARFLIHKEVVCKSSKVFAAALSNCNFIEGQTQTYRLDDTTARAFRMLMQWMYAHELILLETGREQIVKQNLALVETWILADKFDLPALQNYIIEAIYSQLSGPSFHLPIYTSRLVYGQTASGSPLRKLMVSLAVGYMEAGLLYEVREFLPYDFLLDITASFIEGRGSRRTERIPSSTFYVKVEDA
ncbi:uncharacterized protein L3040_002944 [Drepanopeziza brunnea f. sp. 'multigermtubi']|uniref:BTB domain-containing protein n=1 Tax=Marssonina brunnea f. sp. multigermtubi (strain MB_m1) TaxID=1072389 RepID=K1WLP4_MARBU|nr:uncharacterized protein MBM_08585 [Drepanopeziza brunnea f. sp. 'multigermtubi' MB_m1]EKD13142.1 hypothetical protein MBM_08585 [Drepanopeziza brunnea f. sp. 'multigermtubi' MB_m1]KAJ5047101.1 hypothetical protein L3040_002944 [Drepanopeziza brunnea f. sp. 'multigermtubi']